MLKRVGGTIVLLIVIVSIIGCYGNKRPRHVIINFKNKQGRTIATLRSFQPKEDGKAEVALIINGKAEHYNIDIDEIIIESKLNDYLHLRFAPKS